MSLMDTSVSRLWWVQSQGFSVFKCQMTYLYSDCYFSALHNSKKFTKNMQTLLISGEFPDRIGTQIIVVKFTLTLVKWILCNLGFLKNCPEHLKLKLEGMCVLMSLSLLFCIVRWRRVLLLWETLEPSCGSTCPGRASCHSCSHTTQWSTTAALQWLRCWPRWASALFVSTRYVYTSPALIEALM